MKSIDELNRKIALAMNQVGFEWTPQQVKEEREKVCEQVRQILIERGYPSFPDKILEELIIDVYKKYKNKK